MTEQTAFQPLAGVRVLELASSIGAYAARLLADLGADVTVVEPPRGHEMRRRPPFKSGTSGPQASLMFTAYHLNKRSITLDVTRPDAEALLTELAANADVVVASPTRRTPVVGVDRDEPAVRWAPADAVVACVTPFGMVGPYRDYRATPFTSYAMGGDMHNSGPPEYPVAVPDQQLWDQASLFTTAGIMGALRARPRVGGQILDLAAHEVSAIRDFHLERFDIGGTHAHGRLAGVGIAPNGTFQCADGPLVLACHQEHHWDAFLAMVGHPDELSEPGLRDPLLRREIHDGLREIIGELLAPQARLELFERGQAAGMPCSPMNTPAEFVVDAQPVARGTFTPMHQPGVGDIRLPWRPFVSTPVMMQLRRPAPGLGEHNHEVYVTALGHGESELEKWKTDGLI